MDFLCVVYYGFVFLSVFLIFLAWDKTFFFSISNLSLLANLILVSIPGYFVALRFFSIESGQDGFLFLIFLYFISTIIPPISVFLGKKIVINKALPLHFPYAKNLTIRTYCLGAIVCFYSLFYYLYWFDKIPLIHLLLNPFTEKSYLAFLRNALTHDLQTFSPGIPFFLRYWRLIMQQIGLIVFLIFYASIRDPLLNNNKMNKIFVFFFGMVLCFNYLMTFEKAPIIYFIFSLLSIDFFYKKKLPYRKLILVSLLIPVLYIIFMGSSPKDSVKNAVNRIMSQTEGIAEQFHIYEKEIPEKPLLFRNYNFSFWDKVFSKNYINLSNEAYKMKYEYLFNKYNIIGTTGNLHIFSLYTSFGIGPALLFYLTYFILIGSFSSLITKKCKRQRNIYITILLPLLAIYFYSVSTGGLTQLFRSSLIIDPNLILIFLIPFILGIKIKLGKKVDLFQNFEQGRS